MIMIARLFDVAQATQALQQLGVVAEVDLFARRRAVAVGFGQHDHFNVKMRDLRIYSRALSDADMAVTGR